MTEIDNSPAARDARLKALIAELDSIREQTIHLREIEAQSGKADAPFRKSLGDLLGKLGI
jgi:hypothetical protein